VWIEVKRHVAMAAQITETRKIETSMSFDSPPGRRGGRETRRCFFAKLEVDYPKGRFRGNLGFFGDEAKRYLPV